jgi:saccharopine dehydrogenase-like NADP-dependent oxidoreductase
LDTASSIRVLDADNAEVRGYRFAVLFSPETFFEELGATPYYVKNSRVVSGKPLETEIEWIRFPEPIGDEGGSAKVGFPPSARRF